MAERYTSSATTSRAGPASESSVLIKSIWAENFKSFGKRTEIKLSQLTLLIGPNNAGKTNVLEIVRQVRPACTAGPAMLLSARHRAKGGSPTPAGIGLTAEEQDRGRLEVSFSCSQDGQATYQWAAWDGRKAGGWGQPFGASGMESAKMLLSHIDG